MDADLTKKSGDKNAKGEACGKNGKSRQSSGDYAKSIEHHKKHLDIAKESGDKPGIAQAYDNLGDCYRSLGQFDKAIEHHTELLEIVKEIGDKAGEGQACGNLGDCFSSLGKYKQALEYRKMHRDIAQDVEDKAYRGKAYSNLGDCYRSLGKYEKALDQHQLYLDISKEIGDKTSEGKAYGKIGDCYSSMEMYDRAVNYKERQLSIARETGDKASEGMICGDIGDGYQFLRQHDKAIENTQMCLDISEQLEDKEGEGKALSTLGRVYLNLEDYDKAEHHFRKSLECFEKFFETIPGSFESSKRDTFITTNDLLKECLLLHDKKEEALVAAERGRVRALADPMPPTYPIQGAEVTVASLIDLPEIREVVKALDSTVLFFTSTGTIINTWVLQPNGEITHRRAVLKPQPREYSMPRVVDNPYGELGALIFTARELLRAGRVSRIEDRSLACIYGPEDERPRRRPNPMFPFTLMPPFPARPPCTTVTLPVREEPPPKPKRIDKFELRKLQQLHKILLEPVLESVQGSRLVVVPDNSLPLVPFAALADEEGRYIAESMHVRLFPSLATAKMIMQRTPKPEDPSATPLIVGDPEVPRFENKDTKIDSKRLTEVDAQVDKIAKFLKVKPLKAKKATKKAVLERLDRANLIHIAAHGDMAKGNIFLAPSRGISKEKVGMKDVTLTITDIERKRLRAKLVVLSLRHSGHGEVKAEGVMGIARAFLGAGARAVIVNLWQHKNEATTQFMETLYENLVAGERASEALDKTMKTQKQNAKFWHPYLWSSFTLIGEDVTPFPKK